MNNENVFKNMHPLKRLCWPILRSEHSKFLPMLIIYSLVVFNYSLLKTIKDALIVKRSYQTSWRDQKLVCSKEKVVK